jgi:hypothetical protein
VIHGRLGPHDGPIRVGHHTSHGHQVPGRQGRHKWRMARVQHPGLDRHSMGVCTGCRRYTQRGRYGMSRGGGGGGAHLRATRASTRWSHTFGSSVSRVNHLSWAPYAFRRISGSFSASNTRLARTPTKNAKWSTNTWCTRGCAGPSQLHDTALHSTALQGHRTLVTQATWSGTVSTPEGRGHGTPASRWAPLQAPRTTCSAQG